MKAYPYNRPAAGFNFFYRGELTKVHLRPSQVSHCVKSVRIRSYSGPNAGKYGPK